ncbi:MAG: glycosyltransferase [Myxococcales bacterium]
MRRVALVTDELQPLTNGGIGRLLRNFLDDAAARRAPVEFHLLIPRSCGITPAMLRREVGADVRLHLVDLTQDASEVEAPPWDDGLYAAPAAFRGCVWHGQSYQLAQELRGLERSGLVFDTIEFPDFRGWALCSLQEKRLGRAFQHTEIAVRLHSTFGVIQRFEHDPHSPSDLVAHELERQALSLADRVVAHLEPVADFNRDHFGFDQAWRERVVVEFPPVLPQPTGRAQPARPKIGLDTPLVFPSRTNPFKRPHLFVQGATELMRRRPDYRGRAILACHIYHPEYLRRLLDDVPPGLRDRFVVLGPSSAERERLLTQGISVIPSIYESLNLVAYEVSAAGGLPVLNERCLAFGPRTPFIDGENCLKFDGSVDGLAGTLERALEGPELRPVAWRAAIPYWERPSAATPRRRRAKPPLVSVVVTHRDAGARLAATLESVSASSYTEIEAVVVDDGSWDPDAERAVERVAFEARRSPEAVQLVRHAEPRGRAACRNRGAAAAHGELLLFLDAGERIASQLIADAVCALVRDPELAGVLPAVGFFGDETALAEGRFTAQAVPLPEAPCAALLANPAGLRPLLRRSALPSPPFDEMLDEAGPWTAVLELALRGRRLLPTVALGCFVPAANAGSPIDVPVRRALLARLGAGPARQSPRALDLANLLLAALWEGQAAPSQIAVRPLRYEFADGANQALKRVPGIHGILRRPLQETIPEAPIEPETLGLWTPGTPKPLRYELADWAHLQIKRRAPALNPLVKRVVSRFR